MKALQEGNIIMVILLTLFVLAITFMIVLPSLGSINQPGTSGSGPITEYDSIIQQAGFKYGVEPALIKAVIMVESEFNPAAVSNKGAKGLMQLMPATADGLDNLGSPEGLHCKLTITDSFDPEQNINGGTCYLSYLLKKYNNNKELAIAAYNAGPTAVDNCNCVPNFGETQGYVRLVTKHYDDYKSQTGWTTVS